MTLAHQPTDQLILFARAPLTVALLARLKEIDIAVGDGIAPDGVGWQGQFPDRTGAGPAQPGRPRSRFIPYAVLESGAAGPNQRDPLGEGLTNWQVGYVLRSYGALRAQADTTADMLLANLVTWAPPAVELVLGTANWGIQRINLTGLGAVSRNDSVSPPFFERADTFSLWIDRALT